MKHTLSRLRYAVDLFSLKHGYDRFLIEFKKHYPLGTEVQMIDHYIQHYKTANKVADRNIDRNQKSLTHLSDEEFEKLVVRTENHAFDYGNMVNWLEEKKKCVLKKQGGEDKLPKPLELADFLVDENYRDKLPLIASKFNNYTGRDMAIAVFLLDDLEILSYSYNAKKGKNRSALVKTLNPSISKKLSAVGNFFYNKGLKDIIKESDLEPTRKWLNDL